MRACCFDQTLALRDLPTPERPPGEALIRVRMAGICKTDLEITRGYMGFRGILGHEFVGIVEAASTPQWIGKRVVGEINCPCGRCRYCGRSMYTHCVHRTVLGILDRNGAFAEYLTLPERNLHPVPDHLPDEAAVFTEPLAAAFRILEQIAPAPEDRILVLGDGKLGLLITQVLARAHKNVLCAGKHPQKLHLLRARGLATASVHDPIEPGVDIVIDATGAPTGLAHALQLVRPEGTIVLKTTVADPCALPLSPVVIHEVRIIGSRCGPFRPALDALASGEIDPTPMISATYPLDDALAAFEHARQPDVLKVLIRP
jgi:threonine dehydrogenase-like Zn-dependent dehydrogenase